MGERYLPTQAHWSCCTEFTEAVNTIVTNKRSLRYPLAQFF